MLFCDIYCCKNSPLNSYIFQAGLYYIILMDQCVSKLYFLTVALYGFSLIIIYGECLSLKIFKKVLTGSINKISFTFIPYFPSFFSLVNNYFICKTDFKIKIKIYN